VTILAALPLTLTGASLALLMGRSEPEPYARFVQSPRS
jgi:hypothetical protein